LGNQTCEQAPFQQDVENNRQLRSRVVQTLNVPQRVRLGPSLAAASLDGCFDHPAMKNGKSTAGMRRQSTLRREKVANELIGYLMELR